jgi:hypothetical protein
MAKSTNLATTISTSLATDYGKIKQPSNCNININQPGN